MGCWKLLDFYSEWEVDDWTDFYKYSDLAHEVIKYRVAPDNLPVMFSVIRGWGDCYDRARLLDFLFSVQGLNSSVDICSVEGSSDVVLHARNKVYIGDDCFFLDVSFNDSVTIIRSCNSYPDYCI